MLELIVGAAKLGAAVGCFLGAARGSSAGIRRPSLPAPGGVPHLSIVASSCACLLHLFVTSQRAPPSRRGPATFRQARRAWLGTDGGWPLPPPPPPLAPGHYLWPPLQHPGRRKRAAQLQPCLPALCDPAGHLRLMLRSHSAAAMWVGGARGWFPPPSCPAVFLCTASCLQALGDRASGGGAGHRCLGSRHARIRRGA
jgi:hypothetical protein